MPKDHPPQLPVKHKDFYLLKDSLFYLTQKEKDISFSKLPVDSSQHSLHPVIRESLFTGHELSAPENFARKQTNPYGNWSTGVLCSILVLITLTFVLYRRKITLLLQSLFSQRLKSQLLREGKLLNERIYLFTLAIIFLCQSLLFFLLIQFFVPSITASFSSFTLFSIVAGIVVFDYLYKLAAVYISTYLFDYKEERPGFYLNQLFFLAISSFCLFPVLIIVLYTGFKQLILLYALFFIVAYITKIYRSLTLNMKKLNLFQFFLYLCTIEILPYLVIIKLVISPR